MKAYSVILVGQGDTNIKIIDKETFDWIHTDSQAGRVGNESGWIDKACPSSIKNRLEDKDYPYITIGSMHNDRALAAPAIKHENEELSYYDMTEFMNGVKKHNIQIVESFEGYIY